MYILRLGLFYPATTVVCCILVQILCIVSQKSLSPYRGSTPGGPGPRWGTSVPQTPSVLLCPPIILWDRRPCCCMSCSSGFVDEVTYSYHGASGQDQARRIFRISLPGSGTIWTSNKIQCSVEFIKMRYRRRSLLSTISLLCLRTDTLLAAV